MAKMKPLFVVIDGVDGTGKSTQINLLKERMSEAGLDVELTREPGGTDAGKGIREILLNSKSNLNPSAELLLFCADRALHQDKVKSLLADGKSIICDRFLSSTYAYQIFGRKLPHDLLDLIVPKTVSIFPDLTFILDMDSSVAVKRASERLKADGKTEAEGRFEAESVEFFNRVREGFRWYSEQKKFGKSVIVNASGTIDEVAATIWKHTKDDFVAL